MYSIGADGSDERPEPGLNVRSDQISADGRHIVLDESQLTPAFNRTVCPEFGCQGGIVIANRDGSNAKEFEQGNAASPRWSRRGVIAFIRYEDHATAIRRIDARGAAIGRPYVIGLPRPGLSFSPSGTELAYAPRALVVRNLSGKSVRRLSEDDVSDVAWSPDGKEIAAVRHTDDGKDNFDELVVYPVDGSPARLLYRVEPAHFYTSPSFCENVIRTVLDLATPMWSPDGSRLTFLSNAAHLTTASTVQDIVSLNRDGTNLTTLRAARASCEEDRNTSEKLGLLGWRA
jgi:Tol biopolymer transport system component